MARRLILPSLALSVMLMAAAPRDAPAQSVDLSSSMNALCMNAACSLVKFTLNVPDQGGFANALVDIVRVTSTDLTLFDFAAIEQVWNGGGNLYTNDGNAANDTWNPVINSLGTLEIASASGALANDPINILISFSTSVPSALFTGVLTYQANGMVLDSQGSAKLFSTSGQVTPEPVSIALLGTGLLGVAGAARRRKRRVGVDPDSAV